ncbi:DUF2066 domain-containing protein [Methylophaga pinxianii]|uniref:DUF2066 domain-containing protein n=3 Tax=Methylophaga pinxianii TaxID=2881052 RepID=UPI001CF3F05C|nr:DUF2066 domain-containing protein [Methylophaga pinxianii]UPH44529.1 DUF2066 domain-containing protein [Methylophaga pinxianii]
MPRLFFSLIFVFAASIASAAEVTDLYQAQAPVESQSEQERHRLAPKLLQQVVIKVVGDRRAVEQADISALITDAERYIDKFYYQQVPYGDDKTMGNQLVLTLDFNANGVNTALQRIGLPVWDKVRPESLIWMAVEYAGKQQLIGEGDEDSLLLQVEQAAKQRGIPLLLPLMDLEDQTQLTFNDVSTGNNAAVQQASARYGASVIVTARLSGTEESAEISWQAMMGDHLERWSSQGTVQTAIENGISELADRLGRRLNMALSETGESALVIQVSDVHDYAGYSRLMDYLGSLQAVSDIKVGSLGSEKLDLVLRIQAEPEKFRQLLSMGRVIQPNNADNSGSQYRLLP